MKALLKPFIAVALQWEAKRVLRKYKPHVVAVTGSVGKTSTKDAIYTILASAVYVRKSEKSFNSEIGIPLTIIGQPNAWLNPLGWIRNLLEGLSLILLRNHYPKWLVLEVGADRPGDIQKVAGWLYPDIVVVTRLPDVPVHVEFFDSPEAVIDEKSYLPRALRPGGVLILNADDDRASRFRELGEEVTVLTYGFKAGADIHAAHEHIVYENGVPVGMSSKVDYRGSSVPITVRGALGRQSLYAILAALAVGASQGQNLVDMGAALKKHVTPPGRMCVLPGIRSSVLIDDTYNSSPVAAEEALVAFKSTETKGKRIAVLGDMMELGTFSAEAHRALGAQVAEGADVLITVGLRSRYIAEGAHKAGMKKRAMYSCEEPSQATEKLKKIIEEGDTVLLKASQSVRLEKTVRELLAKPEDAGSLLARQDDAWQRR
jgi:UDP-N-acetylmuramoyl-tripeptide--D-alanyl-D-alanine ligase